MVSITPSMFMDVKLSIVTCVIELGKKNVFAKYLILNKGIIQTMLFLLIIQKNINSTNV